MKKTTYIIIATILVAAVASFFLSPVVFRKTGNDSPDTRKTLTGTGKTTTVRTEPFTAISICCSYNSYMMETEAPLSVRIVESAGTQQPSVTFDTAWEGNMTCSVSEDTLNIDLTMARTADLPEDEDSFMGPSIAVSPDIANAATVTVPKGTLRQISSDQFKIILKDFDNASITLNPCYNGFQAEGCSFAELVIGDD